MDIGPKRIFGPKAGKAALHDLPVLAGLRYVSFICYGSIGDRI